MRDGNAHISGVATIVLTVRRNLPAYDLVGAPADAGQPRSGVLHQMKLDACFVLNFTRIPVKLWTFLRLLPVWTTSLRA